MGVADEESWAAQCHTREDCRENERTGGGGVGGVGDGGGRGRRDKIIRVFLKIERSRSQATDAAPPGRVQYVLHLSLVLTLRGVTAEVLGL